jgi:prepilin peptidase CpaA
MILDTARLLLFPALMAFAAASDLFTMTISNRVSLALIAGFIVLAVLGGMGLNDILMHFGAGAAVLAVAFACFAMGWVGGGDAKVAASVALTVLLIQFRQWPLPSLLAGQPWLDRLHDKQSGIPYGIALAIGALIIYPQTEWIKAIDLAHLAMR